MTMNQARFWILGIFLVFLAAQLVALSSVSRTMWPEDFQSLVLKLLAVYSVHLGVILGCIFAQPTGPLEDPPGILAWTAILLVVIWNLPLAWRSLSFVLANQDSATDLTNYLDAVSSGSSFLVAGAIAFFFTKSTEQAKTK